MHRYLDTWAPPRQQRHIPLRLAVAVLPAVYPPISFVGRTEAEIIRQGAWKNINERKGLAKTPMAACLRLHWHDAPSKPTCPKICRSHSVLLLSLYTDEATLRVIGRLGGRGIQLGCAKIEAKNGQPQNQNLSQTQLTAKPKLKPKTTNSEAETQDNPKQKNKKRIKSKHDKHKHETQTKQKHEKRIQGTNKSKSNQTTNQNKPKNETKTKTRKSKTNKTAKQTK